MPDQTVLAPNYYALLGLTPSASAQEVRRAYWEWSKRYHPDTTDLPAAVAREKFHQIKEAYANLSDPQLRVLYDQKLRALNQHTYRYAVMPQAWNRPVTPPQPVKSSSAYLDPTDRPLSAGEIFALFIMGLTLVGCLLLAIAIGLTRGDIAFQPAGLQSATPTAEGGITQFVPNVNPKREFHT